MRSTFVEKSLHETDHETEIVNQGGERSLAGLKEGEENYDQNSSEDAQVTTLDGSEKKEDVRNGMDEVMTQQDILDELEELIIIKEEEGRDGKPHIVITTQGPDHIAELDDDDGNEYERKAVNKFNTGDDVGGKLDKEEENEGEIETHSSTTALPDSQDKADEEKEQDNSTTHQQVRKSSVPQDDHAPTSTTTSRPVLRRQSRQIFDPDVIPTSPPTKSDTRRASTHSDDDDEAKYQTNEKKRQSISKQRDDFTPYSDTESNESNNTVIAASAREATTPSPPHRTQDEQKTKRTTEKRHSLKKQSSDGNNNYTTTTTPSPPASRKGSDTVGENVRLSQAKRNPITDHDNHDGRQDSVPTSRRGSENFEKRDERQDSVPSSRRGSDNFAKREECQDSVPSSRKGSDTAVENVRLSQAKRDSIADHGNDVGRQGSLPSSRRGSDNAEKKEEHPHATMVRGQSIQKRDSTAGLHQGESGNNEKANYSQDGHQKKQASPPHGEEFRRGRSLEENKQEEEIVAKVREGAKRGSITGHPVEKVYDEATSSRRASKAEPAGDHSIQKRGSSDSDQETVQKRALGELSGEMHDQTVGKSHSSEENVSQEKKTPPKGQPVVVRRTSVVSPTKQVNYSQDKQHRSHQSPPIKQHSPDKQGHSRDDHQQVKHNQEHSQTTHKRSNNPPPKRQSSQQRSPPGSKHSPENKVQHGSQKSLENQNQQKSHQSKQHNSPENQTRSTQQLPPAEGSHQSPPDTQSQTRSHQSPPKRAHQSPPAKHSQESSHQSPQAHQKIQTRSSQSPPRVSHSQNDQIQARSHQSPPRHPHQSPPSQAHQSPPKQIHQSPPTHTHQSPPTQAHQSPPAHTHQSPPTQAHQSPPKQIHQSPPTHTHQSPPTQAHQSPPTHTHQSLPSKISPEKQIQARSHPSPPAEKSHDIEPHNPPQDKEHSPESHQQHGSPQSQPPPPTPQHHSSKTQHQPSTDNFSPEKKQEIHASPPTTRSYDGIQHQAHVQSPPEKQHSASDPQSQPLTQLPPIVTHSSAESQTPPQLIHSPPTKESAGSQTTSTHHPHHQTSPPTIKQPLQPTNNNNLGQKPGDHPTPKVRTATTTTTSHHPSSHKLPPEPQHQRSFKQPTYPHRMTKTTIARQALAREKRRAYVEERIQSYMRKSQYASANALHESYIMNKIRNGGLLPDMDSVAAHYGAEDLTAMREKGQGRRFTKLDPASMQSLPDINSYHHYATSYATSSSRRVPFSYHTDPLPPPPPQTLTAISIIKPPPQYYSPIDNSNNNTTTTTNDNHLPDPTTRSNTTSFQSTAETSQNSGIYIDSNPESTSNFWKNVSEQGFYYSFRVRQSGTVQMMDKSVQTGEQPQSYVLDFSRRPDGRYVLQNSRPVNLGSNSNHHHHHINNNHDTTTHLPPINNRK